MASVRPLRQISLEHLTPAQEKFWTLLQDEQNRTLPVLQLCQRAGYKTTASWYTAVRDEPFRERVESLGIVVYREHHESSPRGTIPLASDPDAEWAKDIVDLRSLVSEYPKHVSASALKLNFAFLASPALKALVKRYLRARLGFWQPSSLRSYLRWLKPFLWNVEHLYPDLDSFAPLTRAMIEPLLTAPFWIDERGRRHAISVFGKRYMLIAVEGMFSYMQRHAWEEAPRHLLIYEEDRPSEPKKRPRPIPESVLAHLLSHLDLLHPYARNLVAILSVVGLRAIDALHLTEACLEFDATGDPRLHWYNHKLKRDGRPLPVTMEVAEAIQRQQALVREIPDLFGQRYLFRTKRGLYRFQRFCDHLNELAQHLPIVGPDGHIYRFKPHRFRHTVGIADVMAYLDHMSPEMTLRYAEISDTTLKQKFKALVRISGKRPGVWLWRYCEGNWSKGMRVSWIGSSPICADSRCPGDIVCTMPRPPNVLTGRMCVLRKTMALVTSW